MLNKFKTLSLVVCVSSLSGCATTTPEPTEIPQGSYNFYDDNRLYPEGYEGDSFAPPPTYEQKEVVVPENYFVGPSHAPTSHKDMDKEWISHQNAQNYTIELATGSSAPEVAKTLTRAPKIERTAQIKTQQGYYKGVYGSFPSQEAAQQALNALPQDIKQSAKIQSWSAIQSGSGY